MFVKNRTSAINLRITREKEKERERERERERKEKNGKRERECVQNVSWRIKRQFSYEKFINQQYISV